MRSFELKLKLTPSAAKAPSKIRRVEKMEKIIMGLIFISTT
jgi:hypothetical protein